MTDPSITIPAQVESLRHGQVGLQFVTLVSYADHDPEPCQFTVHAPWVDADFPQIGSFIDLTLSYPVVQEVDGV